MGVFPKVWKTAEIDWIPKKDEAPTSMLPMMGKLIKKRLQRHLEYTGNIDCRQYAYREGQGTADALRIYVQQLKEVKATIALDRLQ